MSANVAVRSSDGCVVAAAWGPGAGWFLDGLPALLGADDDTSGFDPRDHPVLREVLAQRPGWRVPRSRLVLEALIPAVLEQRVTGMEARRAFQALVLRHGDLAPGPAPEGMRVPPSEQAWSMVPSWEWHRAGVGGTRSRTVMQACQVASRLEETVSMSSDAAQRRLRAVPGIGAWTAAEVAQRALGDADAVSVGDFHLCSSVGVALTGHPVDDDGMLELMAPYAGHRYRVQRLVELSGIHKERRGARYAPRDMRAI